MKQGPIAGYLIEERDMQQLHRIRKWLNEAERPLDRRGLAEQMRRILKAAVPVHDGNRSGSVRAVSGGLPSLGKRR
jgi:hypothetical protein